MNKRIVSVIQKLGEPERDVNIPELAEQFKVSQRTIRNDLNAVNDILRAHGLSELKLSKGGRVIRDQNFREVLAYVKERDFYDYKLSKEEREKIAAILLIGAPGYITLLDIADHMAVSRATVINDLERIKAYIDRGNLKVCSHPNKGLRVEGRESDKRIFLMKLADHRTEVFNQDVVRKQIDADSGIREVLFKILYEQEHVYESILSDASFQRILCYLGIMTNRVKQGAFIEKRQKRRGGKYEMAESILRYVERYCDLTVTEDETDFLSELLSSERYIRQKLTDKNSIKAQMAAREFIEQMSQELKINLNQDYDFFENLSAHLESAISADPMEYGKNPVIEKVLEENASVMEAVKRNLSVIREYAGRDLTEGEMGDITVHVCAAVERKKNREIAFHVIVACHAGIGTSRLLVEKLKKHFHFQSIEVMPSHEAGNLARGQADLVISTVPLEECKIESIVVSPLLKDEDYIRISSRIDRLRSQKVISLAKTEEIEEKRSAKELIERMAPVLYDKVPEEAGELAKELGRIVKEYFRESEGAEDETYSPYLYQLLPASHIRLNVECKNWREAVRCSAKALLDLGYIEERYVDAMIRSIEENGPYIVLSGGFAFPHEGVDQGTKKLGMSLIRLASPVEFHAEDKDPVEFVCCLSAVDYKTHLRAFFHLVNMLKKEDFKEALRESRTPEAMTEVIRRYEHMVLAK